jgi:hypothetical protein
MSNCSKENDCPINKLFDNTKKCPYKNITKNIISHGVFAFFIFKLIKKVMNQNKTKINDTDNLIEFISAIPDINSIFDLSSISGNLKSCPVSLNSCPGNLKSFSGNLNSCPVNLKSCPKLPIDNISGNIEDNISKLLSPNNIEEIGSLLNLGGMGSIGSLVGLLFKNLTKEQVKPIVTPELNCVKSKTTLFSLLAKTILVIFSFIIIKIILDIIFDIDEVGLKVEMDFGDIKKTRNKKKSN